MAKFEITESEGVRWVTAFLENEQIRAEHRALNHMVGKVSMDMPFPSLRSWWVSVFSEESLMRPRFTGTGEVCLDSTLGGYHSLQVRAGERWVLDNRCYWTSDGSVDLAVYRERMLTAFWAGEGFLWYKTSVKGEGQVILAVDGPVEEVELKDGRMIVDGAFVIARTDTIKFTLKRPARSLLSYWLSGEQLSRCYEGTGRMLVCWTPYWRLMLLRNREVDQALLP